jgi:3-hydroxyisobutyrate dehydrogenase-like beta-hydroxyacid dehydrogenase
MKKIGIVGLGNMGIGMAKNLIDAGFPVGGFDLSEERRKMLSDLGGKSSVSIGEVGKNSDCVFVMVMNGAQVQSVVLGEDGLLDTMKSGSCIVVSATIKASEIRVLVEPAEKKGIDLIDSPVSGGKGGADSGTLTLMAAAGKAVLEEHRDVLDAVSKAVFHVGESIGQGQVVKAALQALIGASFTAIFESLVLGTKAGADPEILYEVFCSSGIGSSILKNCGELILDRKFENTGSHIGTMYKDIGISMAMARENGCALFTASSAYELFQTGISLYPEGDNWAIVKFLEQIAGTEVKRSGGKK